MATLRAERITRASSGIEEVRAVHRSVFPRDEQVPLWVLLWRSRREGIDFIKFSEGDAFVGYAYTITYLDLVYVFYLAVSPAVQSKGYGSRILHHIEEAHPKSRMVLEIEDPEQAAENSKQRQRRKAFYLMNGYTPVGLKTVEGDVIYEMLAKNGTCTAAEFTALMKRFSGLLLRPFYKPRFTSG
jgi:GNAT superfamily N-acetyltransferase